MWVIIQLYNVQSLRGENRWEHRRLKGLSLPQHSSCMKGLTKWSAFCGILFSSQHLKYHLSDGVRYLVAMSVIYFNIGTPLCRSGGLCTSINCVYVLCVVFPSQLIRGIMDCCIHLDLFNFLDIFSSSIIPNNIGIVRPKPVLNCNFHILS